MPGRSKSCQNIDPECKKKKFQDEPRNFMNISQSIAQRLQTGTVDYERLKNYDQNWIDKLREIDENHTIENNLNTTEVYRILETLSDYSSGAVVKTCPVDKSRLIECYKAQKGDTLKCEKEVNEFISCIDNLLYKATHIDERTAMSLVCPKKMTYRERMEETCLNK